MYTVRVYGWESQPDRGGSVGVNFCTEVGTFNTPTEACLFATAFTLDAATILLNTCPVDKYRIGGVRPSRVRVESGEAIIAVLEYQMNRLSIPELNVPVALHCVKYPFRALCDDAQPGVSVLTSYKWRSELHALSLVTDGHAQWASEQPFADGADND